MFNLIFEYTVGFSPSKCLVLVFFDLKTCASRIVEADQHFDDLLVPFRSAALNVGEISLAL